MLDTTISPQTNTGKRMSRTEGSGWGAGPMLYQVCPSCGKKKCIYDPVHGASHYMPFRCLAKYCKKRNYSDTLVRQSNAAYAESMGLTKTP